MKILVCQSIKTTCNTRQIYFSFPFYFGVKSIALNEWSKLDGVQNPNFGTQIKSFPKILERDDDVPIDDQYQFQWGTNFLHMSLLIQLEEAHM